jgi:hypothetical protein
VLQKKIEKLDCFRSEFRAEDRHMKCSFCRRHDSEVAKLVAGPRRIFGRVYICDRCAAQTIAIMENRRGDDRQRASAASFFRQVLKRLGWNVIARGRTLVTNSAD